MLRLACASVYGKVQVGVLDGLIILGWVCASVLLGVYSFWVLLSSHLELQFILGRGESAEYTN
jgi:hypothetical protein